MKGARPPIKKVWVQDCEGRLFCAEGSGVEQFWTENHWAAMRWKEVQGKLETRYVQPLPDWYVGDLLWKSKGDQEPDSISSKPKRSIWKQD